jgi:hypothetical protein
MVNGSGIFNSQRARHHRDSNRNSSKLQVLIALYQTALLIICFWYSQSIQKLHDHQNVNMKEIKVSRG